ncbi:MAG: hypothetical protein KDK99_17095 [Verrucomicrobiales bacterium]|nr:hypothetical protein [Verrucomicrobiales bacterium]
MHLPAATAYLTAVTTASPPSHLQRVVAWLHRQPLKFLWLLVLWMAFVLPWLQRDQNKPGEFYPFSNLPMYSSFAPSTYYVYVTDLADQPVAIKFLSGQVLSNIKKTYESELKKQKSKAGGSIKLADLPIEKRHEAGNATLHWLVPFCHADQLAQLGGLRLRQVSIDYREGRIEKTELPVGEVHAPTAPAP